MMDETKVVEMEMKMGGMKAASMASRMVGH